MGSAMLKPAKSLITSLPVINRTGLHQDTQVQRRDALEEKEEEEEEE